MNILILNGSPRGNNSITLQTVFYLQKIHPEHNFTILQVGQRIRRYEKDFKEALVDFENAELVLFAYPVYTFIVPYQLQRFIELMKEHHVQLQGKFASQVSTSKHFYDITAHKFIEEICSDFKMNYVQGLSADMDDLLEKKGQKQAEDYFKQLIFNIENNIYKPHRGASTIKNNTSYEAVLPERPKLNGNDVVIVTNYAETDVNLQNMIADFCNILPYPSAVVNLRNYPFSGGCLGCFSCATSAKCVHKDGFDDFLRQEIQTADALVYAFTIENHYTHSSFKLYDDRQFCNGHRMLTIGLPIGFIISGDYRGEANLQTIIEARSEVGGCYLSGIATDEEDTVKAITSLSKSVAYALEHRPSRPQNFYGVGGTKIFRDLIYLMQGLMKADHKFYKHHKIYDFPQKQRLKILKMHLIGCLMSIPAMQKGMKGKMNKVIVAPYKKVIAAAVPSRIPNTEELTLRGGKA